MHQGSLGARAVALPLVGLIVIAGLGGGIASAPPDLQGTTGQADPPGDSDTASDGPQPAEQTQLGWVLLPTTEAARLFTPQSLRSITFEKVQVTGDATFLLREQRSGGASACTGNICVQSGDFDLIFFRERSDGTATVVTRHAETGDETGRVPPNANFAYVFLRTPALQQDARGSGFVYLESAPGGTVLPAWP